MNEAESISLDAECDRCGTHLVLTEGGRDHLVECPVCDAEPGAGATPADALEHWFHNHPAPRYVPTDLATFTVPRQPSWVFEVDGFPCATLSAAESLSKELGHPIFCRLGKGQKVANS